MTYGPIIRFNELFGGNPGTDRVRQQQVPKVGPTLDYLGLSRCILVSKRHLLNQPFLPTDEAFTSENWIVSLIPKFYCFPLHF
jgi:dolichyl-diphosphooligosaccharide--protein glycosyltransferase